jgi:murein DD-endopeptidase MepM/ murein hydrolase activator NlpD
MHRLARMLPAWLLLAACSAALGQAPTPGAGPTQPVIEATQPSAANPHAKLPEAGPEVLVPGPNPADRVVQPLTFDADPPEAVSLWRPPPYPAPWALRPEDHFIFARPIPSGEINWPNPGYRYGSTAFGELPVHTGVDLGAARHTPVLAAAAGEVVWVGFGLYRGVEDYDDPYGLAVALRHDFGYGRQRLYTAYAHLQSALVWPGQRVEAGEQIGTVGDTGFATAPHLHFEVRIEENRYFNTRNPELWMVPAEGWGILAGRVQNTYGTLLAEYLLQIRSLDTEQVWEVWTYARGTVVPDEIYQENFVISDLPAGAYAVEIDFGGREYVTYLYLYPGQTTLVHFAGRRGFLEVPDTLPPDLTRPPYP